MNKSRVVVFCAVALFGASPALADDAPDEELRTLRVTPSPWKDFRLSLDGYLRVRADVWNDLDLSRGPTPSGQTLFPTPAAGGDEHTLTAIDMRLRLEPTLEVGQAVRIRARIDVLDNVGWGSTPDVLPSATGLAVGTQSQLPPRAGVNSLRDVLAVKQVWGEVTLPFGVLTAGRTGPMVGWGTGFFFNNGSCTSCDGGDTGDRIALTIPFAGHFLSALYELSAAGPSVPDAAGALGQSIPVERRAQVHTGALSFWKVLSPEAQRRVLRAGRTLVQYGVLLSYRGQNLDVPAWTQGGLVRDYGPSDFVHRNAQTFAGDLWLMVHRGGLRAELEVATVIGRIGDVSTVPGVSLRAPVVSRQWGGVASLSYALQRFPLRLRFELGVASGDAAPGFGNSTANVAPRRGDLDGAQAKPPGDLTVDNFRFHPDYRVDLILWRRLLGRVTDAVYAKPTLRLGPFGSASHHFTADLSTVTSNALYATTPPGQASYLGTELDVALRYRYEAGFEINLGYGLFLPGKGLGNLERNLKAQPAQTLELILAYRI